MHDMPHTCPMIPIGIPDPTFLKQKVSLAWDAGNDHGRVLVN